MGRSVSYLSDASAVFYLNPDLACDDTGYDWDFFMEDLTEGLKNSFPSLRDCNRWDGRETKIFLENNHTEIGVSEYCGLVSISLRPSQDDYDNLTGLSEKWINRIKSSLSKFFEPYQPLKRVGTFSNGEAVFERAI